MIPVSARGVQFMKQDRGHIVVPSNIVFGPPSPHDLNKHIHIQKSLNVDVDIRD